MRLLTVILLPICLVLGSYCASCQPVHTNLNLRQVATNANGAQVIHLFIHTNLPRFTLTIWFGSGPQNKEVGFIKVNPGEDAAALQTFIWEPEETSSLGIGQIMVQDMNFDGYLDVGLLSWWGATGNRGYRYWLFDPAKGMFLYCDQLHWLTSPWPDPKSKTIRTHAKGGHMGMIFEDKEYQWQNGQLLLIRKIQQTVHYSPLLRWGLWLQDKLNVRWIANRPQYVRVTTELRGGKWIVVNEKVIKPDEFSY